MIDESTAWAISDERTIKGSNTPCGKQAGPSSGILLLISLFAGNAFVAMAYDGLPPIIPAIAEHFGGGERGALIAQLATTLPMLGIVLSGLFAGFIVRRLGFKTVLLMSMAFFGVFGTMGWMLDDSTLLLVTRVITGLAGGIMLSCCLSLVATIYGTQGCAHMTGRLFCSGSVFAILFLILSGAVASIQWRLPFLLHGLLTVLFIGPVLLARFPPVIKPDGGSEKAPNSIRQLVAILPACLMGLSMSLIGNLFSIQITFVLTKAGLGEPSFIALNLSLLAIAAAISAFVYGWILKTLGTARMVQLMYALIAIAALIVVGASSAAHFLFAAVCSGVALGISMPAATTLALRKVPLELAPMASGFAVTAMFLGSSLSPLVAWPLRLSVGLTGQYAVVAVGCAAGLLLNYCFAAVARARSRPALIQ